MRFHAQRKRRGLTLLELLVVVVLMGIFSTVAMARFGRSLFGDFGSQSEARRLALDLLQAQRMAIRTGDNHYLQFTDSGGRLAGYQVYRRSSAGVEPADTYKTFSDRVTVTASHSVAEFTFEGQALAAYQFSLSGDHRNWAVHVVPVNGAVRVLQQ